MKRFEVHRNIRKRAMVMGLSIPLFALMMVSVVCTLLIMIFSFNLGVIVALLFANVLLYGTLVQWVRRPFYLGTSRRFPKSLSHKNITPLPYGAD
ncbi:hypothetical protein F8C76_02085 [Flagellimonas olearia]|uniref:DUF4133 domain-containing protein n=1 Tax=Flagellimonas olearia TaxID=552546 RepID=A0A6I1E326_9FLAO|nr:hypothetical protein [Allomuricauda olearia]KAB7530320.1 hypothetical protein F8C76_02085 [Allomuricauda olearia]